MKKFLSGILALAMILSLSVGAMATEITTSGDTAQNVTAAYTAGAETSWGETIYSVNIAWEPVGSIAYTAGNGVVYQWNATDTKYDVVTEATDGKWNLTAGNEDGKNFTGMMVTVSNSSNAEVYATVAAVAVEALGVTGAIDGVSTRKIDSAAPETPSAENLTGSVQSVSFNYKITDIANAPEAPAEGNSITVATITVTLSKTGA